MKMIPGIAGGLAGAIAVKLIRKAMRSSRKTAHLNGSHKKTGSGTLVNIGLGVAGLLVSAAISRWIENHYKQSLVSPYNPPAESYKPVMDITV